jgi:transcriptional regulator with XRE-family HTH domain
MKKKTKHKHPLAQLRKALGKNQRSFAGIIGISESYVRLMEQGKRKVPPAIARLLMLLFGCDPRSVVKDKALLEHLLPRDAPLEELIQEWESYFPIVDTDTDFLLQELLIPKLSVLCSAAANRQHALRVLCELDDWISRAGNSLHSAVNQELKTRAERSEPVDWSPLVKIEEENEVLIFAMCVSDDTEKWMNAADKPGKKRSKKTSPAKIRGIPQVNPGKMKRLIAIVNEIKRRRTD